MADVHSWIMEHTQSSSNIFPVRNTGWFNGGSSKNLRGTLFYLEKSKTNIVFSDNELAVWIYLNAHKYFDKKSFNDLLNEKIIPVADSRARGESDGKFLLETVARPWSNIIHSHIFDAGKYITKDILEANREEVISRFIRLAHPMNHFLFPKDCSVRAEQNGSPEYQYVAAMYMKEKYPVCFNEFISKVNPGINFDWNMKWEEIGNFKFNDLKMEGILINPTPLDNQIHIVHIQLPGAIMITRLPSATNGCNKMNKGPKDLRELSTRKIPRGFGLNDYKLEIGWHIPGTGMQPVGKFSFDLESLYLKDIISVNADNQYIFTIKRNGSMWYLGKIPLP
jgi:hypothetical protein